MSFWVKDFKFWLSKSNCGISESFVSWLRINHTNFYRDWKRQQCHQQQVPIFSHLRLPAQILSANVSLRYTNLPGGFFVFLNWISSITHDTFLLLSLCCCFFPRLYYRLHMRYNFESGEQIINICVGLIFRTIRGCKLNCVLRKSVDSYGYINYYEYICFTWSMSTLLLLMYFRGQLKGF